MSTTAEYSALISVLTFDATLNYCDISVVALLMYYYLTTLNEEFKYYFKRKITLATLLYITNRYVPLAYAFYNAPLFAYSSNLKKCEAEAGLEAGLECLQYFPWAIFSALRTYALQRKLPWAIIIFLLSLAPIIVSSVSYPVVFVDRNMLTDYSVPALARAPMIIGDVIVIIVTWQTQYKTYNLGKKLSTPSILTMVLLRDGTVYFMVLTALNILQLVFEYLQVVLAVSGSQTESSNLVVFIEPLSAILISEFLTHLHDAANNAPATEISSTGTLEFRVIGSIGATLPSLTEAITQDEAGGDGSEEHPDENWADGDVVGSRTDIEEIRREV
ncbi:hypothetical protein ONZ51_g10616 [Trametes cubensis]|uniref:DUF6533 domain-containing protein n=1 Tax=Trametes cubensis TaxID=1111947 RepID=A0AAD7TJP7_9APHY|nr:hypothetical protein ONZ51_g10616 [Trametes cubensis]